jgi:small subunit ribosomal protein S8e
LDVEGKSNHVVRTLEKRKVDSALDAELTAQLTSGRILARLASRPGQSGRADGYLLEGKELEFYLRKLRSKKN